MKQRTRIKILKKTFVALAISFLVISGLNAHPINMDTVFAKKTGLSKDYLNSYWKNTRDLAISPLGWKKNDILKFAAFTGVSAIIYSFDEKIYSFFQNNKSSALNNLSKYGLEPIGSGLYPVLGFGSLYIYGLIFNRKESRDLSLLAAKTFVISGLVAQVSKLVFGRHRPYNDEPTNPTNFEPFNFKYTSYLSGHTTIAFSMATIIAREFSDKAWVPVISYTLATFAGLSRIYDNKHWPTDVIGGAVLGYTIGRFMHMRGRKINISPRLGTNFSGISVVIPVDGY